MCPTEAQFKGYIGLDIELCTVHCQVQQDISWIVASRIRPWQGPCTRNTSKVGKSLPYSTNEYSPSSLVRFCQLARLNKSEERSFLGEKDGEDGAFEFEKAQLPVRVSYTRMIAYLKSQNCRTFYHGV